MMYEWVCCRSETTSHQLPIAVTFWITWLVSAEECSGLMQNFTQICCSICSVILTVTATQYTCSLNSVYLPHWHVQRSHCSHMCIPVYSPSLPGYINVLQTVLILLVLLIPCCICSYNVLLPPMEVMGKGPERCSLCGGNHHTWGTSSLGNSDIL